MRRSSLTKSFFEILRSVDTPTFAIVLSVPLPHSASN